MTATRSFFVEAEAILRESPAVPFLRDVSLRTRTAFGLGGPARLFLTPREPDRLAVVLRRLHEAEVPFEFLGAGSNLLVADEGPPFVVIASEGFDEEPDISGDRVRVGAGYPAPKLVKRLVKAGLSGIEFAEGIPGSVGGCVRMNAGWHEGAFGNAVAEVASIARHGAIEPIVPDPETFAYRKSPGLDGRLVTGVTLRLQPDDPILIQERVRGYHDQRVRTQPAGARNAGCVFKNPPGDHAGRLIDAAGLKGAAIGRAVVSDIHANFIINQGGATCSEVRRLIDLVRDKVRRSSGVSLEQEVILWT